MEIIDEETGLNDKTYEMQLKKVRHLRIPEKPDILMTSQERIQRDLEKRTGLKSLTKEEADTMVCDGAILVCSHGFYPELETPGAHIDFSKNYTNSIVLKVPDYMAGTFLMGKDGAATTFCVQSNNFKVNPNLQCRKGGKCILYNMANEWTNTSKTVILDGFSALTKDSVLTCKNCPEARISIVDNGQDIEIIGAGWEKWLVDHKITPELRRDVSRGFRLFQVIGGGAEFLGGIFLLVTGTGTLAGIVTMADGIRNISDGLRSAIQEETGEDPYVSGLSVIGIPGKDAEDGVWMYDTTFFIIDGYNIAKGITKIKKPFSFKDIKEVSDHNINEEARAMFFEADRINALEENSKNLNTRNAQLKNAKATFELNFGNEDINRLSAKKRKSFLRQNNAINSLEQSQAALIKNREYLKNNTYIPDYQSPKFYSLKDWNNIKDVSKDSASKVFDAIQNSKSVSELQVNYAKGRYGSRVRILPRNK